MSLNRWNARRDASEPAIVQALEQAGALVQRCDFVDLVIFYHGRLYLMDAKVERGITKKSTRKTKAQLQLVKDGWPVIYVTDPLQALTAIGAIP